MAVRRIIEIDEDRCNGCGLCAEACHEGAIGMAGGKAKLLRDDYCDGLGDCLPTCPTNAIRFVAREAAGFDKAAVEANQAAKRQSAPAPGGCPGTAARQLQRNGAAPSKAPAPAGNNHLGCLSELRQWPVQIKLAPPAAPFYQGADLLLAADCTAYAYAAFHSHYMRGRVTLIGCPKLDGVDYAEKLGEILKNNDIRSLTVARMQVPCCGGLEHAARQALAASGKDIPLTVAVISTDGQLLEERS